MESDVPVPGPRTMPPWPSPCVLYRRRLTVPPSANLMPAGLSGVAFGLGGGGGATGAWATGGVLPMPAAAKAAAFCGFLEPVGLEKYPRMPLVRLETTPPSANLMPAGLSGVAFGFGGGAGGGGAGTGAVPMPAAAKAAAFFGLFEPMDLEKYPRRLPAREETTPPSARHTGELFW